MDVRGMLSCKRRTVRGASETTGHRVTVGNRTSQITNIVQLYMRDGQRPLTLLHHLPPCPTLSPLAQRSGQEFPMSPRTPIHPQRLLLVPILSFGDTLSSGFGMATLCLRLSTRVFASTVASSPLSQPYSPTCSPHLPLTSTRPSMDAQSCTFLTHRTTSRTSSTYSSPRRAYSEC